MARNLGRTLLAAAALLLGACDRGPGGHPPPHRDPILLFTVEGLRADAVGALGGPPGLTPNLDRLARGADWIGRAVAPSSGFAPCLASLFTGLRPWQHQVTGAWQLELPPDAATLAEALGRLGFRARGYPQASLPPDGNGLARGFATLTALGRGNRAIADLRDLAAGPELVWVHLSGPHLPYVRRDALSERVGPVPAGLPRRATWIDLEPYFDPAVALPARERERLQALYRFNVAWTDLNLGRFLRAVEQSGQAERSIIAVVSLYGQEFGEHGQVSAGGNLGRAGIEVPLVLKLPRGSRRAAAVARGERVAAARLWATLVEAAGGSVPPGAGRSLFSDGSGPIFSELFAAAGHNEFSLLEGDLQLRWTRRFSDLDGSYYPARLASAGAPRESAERQAFRLLLRRLDRTYRRSRPLTGPASSVALSLERWTAEGGVQAVDDAARRQSMAERLRSSFLLFVGAELTPDEALAGF